jgi:iron complex transport system permease protein
VVKAVAYRRWLFLLPLITALIFIVNISLGSVSIPLGQTIKALFGGTLEKASWEFIILDYRLPKALTALMTGSGLAVAGLLMQTLFRNPLAGPFVLGISSGASLGVAILIMGVGAFGAAVGYLGEWSLVVASATGSLLVMLVVLSVTFKIKDYMAILIIGLMFGSVTSATVSVLSYFTDAEELQRYVFWGFGSLGNLSWKAVSYLAICTIVGVLLAFMSSKSLNALLLGQHYARSLGVKLRQSTLLIVVATSILAGGITAFAGPIAFVGLAVPHLTRQLVRTSDHLVLIPAVMASGSILMLICDSIAQLPWLDYTLPINAVTSMIGAPVVIWLLVRKRKLLF